jgi:hypothetical protein
MHQKSFKQTNLTNTSISGKKCTNICATTTFLAVVSVSAFCVEVIVKVLVTVAIYSLFMWDVYFQVRLVEYGELEPSPPPTFHNQCSGSTSGSGSVGSVCFGPPGSASGSVSHMYGSGSLSFLIKVLSGLKEWWLQNII